MNVNQSNIASELTQKFNLVSSNSIQFNLCGGAMSELGISAIKYTRIDKLQSTTVATICNQDLDFDNDYRFGFNGQEKYNEVKGIGNNLAFKFKIYDSRLGKFDPLTQSYPWYTPCQFAGNTPIAALDIEGDEPLDYRQNSSYVAGRFADKCRLGTLSCEIVFDKLSNQFWIVGRLENTNTYLFYTSNDNNNAGAQIYRTEKGLMGAMGDMGGVYDAQKNLIETGSDQVQNIAADEINKVIE